MEALMMAMFGVGRRDSVGGFHKQLDEHGSHSAHTKEEVSHHEGCRFIGSLMVKRVAGRVSTLGTVRNQFCFVDH